MRKNYILLIIAIVFSSITYGQNAIVGTGFSTGWGGGSCAPGNSDFSYLSASAGTSYITTLNANGTGDQYFRFGVDWSGTTSQLTINPGSDDLLSPETIYTLSSSCTTSGAMYFNVSSTSDNYVFKTLDAGTSPTGNFIVFRVQGDVRSASAVSTPSGTTYPGATNTITATLDGALSTGQGVYLRYSTDGFTTSTIVEMTGGGTTYTADIGPAVNTASANVQYYVFTSGDGLTISSTDADFYTINLNNNSSSNYSYTVSSSYASTADGNWSSTSTWLDGTVPESSENVVINNNVTLDQDDTVASVTISSGNSLTLNTGFGLEVTGDFSNSGTATANSGSSLRVGGSSTGNITYNRNLGTTNWYLVSSPFVGQGIVDFYSTESPALGSGSGDSQNVGIAPYDNTQTTGSARWVYYTEGQVDGVGGDDTSDTFGTGVGYSVKLQSAQDVAFTGTMITADQGVAISDGTGSGGNAFNLIGNPYPSFLAANNNADGTNNILKVNDTDNDYLTESTIWLWNQGTSSYDIVNHTGTNYIAPGQGFFVSANGSNTFSFTEAMQSHQSSDSFQRQVSSRPEINLVLSDGSETKDTDIFYIDGTSTGFDDGYDSSIFEGVSNPFMIYTHLVSDSQGKNLGIQSLPDADYESNVIPVGINATSGTQITISAFASNLPAGINVYLEDKTDNSFTLLNDTESFTTTLTSDLNDIGRFYLHTSSEALSVDELNLDNISVYNLSQENQLRVVGVQNGNAQVRMFNILGKQVLNTSFEGLGTNDIPLPNLRTGVYIVQLETATGKLNKKVIIE